MVPPGSLPLSESICSKITDEFLFSSLGDNELSHVPVMCSYGLKHSTADDLGHGDDLAHRDLNSSGLLLLSH